MFAAVYVLLPFSDVAPAEAVRASLSPFQRGGRGDVPDAWLSFHDETDHVRAMHGTRFAFTELGRGGIRIEGEPCLYLDTLAVRAEMSRQGLKRWEVRFADIEPDIDAFVESYVERLERHPVAGGYGRWLNPLGQWDWWDLGGRFDGRILGERRRPGVRRSGSVSSGPSSGRALLANVTDVIAGALGEVPPESVVVGVDANIEMVSRLVADSEADSANAYPEAVLLPPGSVEDRIRWVHAWPRIEPGEAIAWLGLHDGATWEHVVTAAYRRFPDHWAACVAYHL